MNANGAGSSGGETAPRRDLSKRLLPVRGRGHLEALLAKRHRDDLDDVRLVIDDEDPVRGAHGHSIAGRRGSKLREDWESPESGAMRQRSYDAAAPGRQRLGVVRSPLLLSRAASGDRIRRAGRLLAHAPPPPVEAGATSVRPSRRPRKPLTQRFCSACSWRQFGVPWAPRPLSCRTRGARTSNGLKMDDERSLTHLIRRV
jgi:hypothetical protein